MNNYSNVKAVKSGHRRNSSFKDSKFANEKVAKSVIASPIAIVICVMLILGALAGYFACDKTSCFELREYAINGVNCATNDYVVIDATELISKNYGDEQSTLTTEKKLNTISLEDSGVICKFFGQDISDSVTVLYLYREDISCDVVLCDKVDIQKAGVYYIKYQSSHFAFKNATLIRTVVVTEVEI